MAKLAPIFNDAQLISGIPANGAKLFTYVAGSSTKLTTYTDEAGLVAQSNPIILNSRGEPAQPIWLTEGLIYKFVFAPSTDSDPPVSPIRTIDNITGINDASLTIDQWIDSGLVPTYVTATSFTVQGDQTSVFSVNRRFKALVTSGTVYGYISSSVFTSLTTVTVVNDTLPLDSGLSSVSLGLLTPDNTSIPNTVFMKTGGTVTGQTTFTAETTFSGDAVMSGSTLKLAKGADVASAAALPLITDGNYFDVTGTTTITSFASMGVGTQITLQFDGVLTLTHNATDLILPGAANIITAAGDEATFIEYASGDWRCINYTRANGISVNAFRIFVARDEKANNTLGGSSVSGSYQTRVLNTVQQNNITGASLASNQVTLPAGTYYVDAVSPFFRVNAVKLKLVNVTDTADLIIGGSTSAAAVDSSPTDATLKGYFTLTGTKAIELQYRCATTLASNGLGIACNFGDIEVYSTITFIKIT